MAADEWRLILAPYIVIVVGCSASMIDCALSAVAESAVNWTETVDTDGGVDVFDESVISVVMEEEAG